MLSQQAQPSVCTTLACQLAGQTSCMESTGSSLWQFLIDGGDLFVSTNQGPVFKTLSETQ